MYNTVVGITEKFFEKLHAFSVPSLQTSAEGKYKMKHFPLMNFYNYAIIN